MTGESPSPLFSRVFLTTRTLFGGGSFFFASCGRLPAGTIRLLEFDLCTLPFVLIGTVWTGSPLRPGDWLPYRTSGDWTRTEERRTRPGPGEFGAVSGELEREFERVRARSPDESRRERSAGE